MKNKEKPALRRYFFDTEFNAKAGRFTAELISIGIVAEDGREYYGISNEFNLAAASSLPWLKENVIDKLDDPSRWVAVEEIKEKILAMIEPAEEIELWAWNGSYDNFIFCQIFGDMGDMREAMKAKGIERVTFRDRQELLREMPYLRVYTANDSGMHVAINDARDERSAFLLYQRARELNAQMPPVHLPPPKM